MFNFEATIMEEWTNVTTCVPRDEGKECWQEITRLTFTLEVGKIGPGAWSEPWTTSIWPTVSAGKIKWHFPGRTFDLLRDCCCVRRNLLSSRMLTRPKARKPPWAVFRLLCPNNKGWDGSIRFDVNVHRVRVEGWQKNREKSLLISAILQGIWMAPLSSSLFSAHFHRRCHAHAHKQQGSPTSPLPISTCASISVIHTSYPFPFTTDLQWAE